MAVEKVKSGELRAHSKKPLLSRSSPRTVQQLSPKLALRVLLNKAQIRMKLRSVLGKIEARSNLEEYEIAQRPVGIGRA